MPEWYVSDPYINVWIFDTPLSYQPSVGSEVAVNLMWRERGLTMFTLWDQNKFTELGNSWCFPWRAAITPGSFDDVTGYGSATMCLPSGGTLGVEFFNWSNLSDHNYFNNTTLERVIDPGTQEQTAYVVHYPDGAQDVYGFVATNEYNYVIRYCLSSRIDPRFRSGPGKHGRQAHRGPG